MVYLRQFVLEKQNIQKKKKEEREKHDRDFEKILKTYKILGENETIKHEE